MGCHSQPLSMWCKASRKVGRMERMAQVACKIWNAPLTILLVLTVIAGVTAWQSSVRPISAQVDAWSCADPAAASPTASPKAEEKPEVDSFPSGQLMVFAAASLTDA